jgi:hypothetical protein
VSPCELQNGPTAGPNCLLLRQARPRVRAQPRMVCRSKCGAPARQMGLREMRLQALPGPQRPARTDLVLASPAAPRSQSHSTACRCLPAPHLSQPPEQPGGALPPLPCSYNEREETVATGSVSLSHLREVAWLSWGNVGWATAATGPAAGPAVGQTDGVGFDQCASLPWQYLLHLAGKPIGLNLYLSLGRAHRAADMCPELDPAEDSEDVTVRMLAGWATHQRIPKNEVSGSCRRQSMRAGA